MFYKDSHAKLVELAPLPKSKQGKIYADVPLAYFANIEALKKYVTHLKEMGVNVLLILPHFLPSFSPYVVKNYEKPASLFGDWQQFADFMGFVKDLGMDRMIDIPFNHADWQADNLKREWYTDYEKDGIEAGADDVDADGKLVRINWGAYILDNSLKELQEYWLERVIYPHIEKYNVNAIRIDAAWGLDSEGLKAIVTKTKAKFGDKVWFLAENLGMAPLLKLAESALGAGADRFFNNMYWYSGGNYIPKDVYKLYKASKGAPTCSIYSSHDTLFPAMKCYARLRANDVQGLNDKAIARKFVEYEGISSLAKLAPERLERVAQFMMQDFTLAALMSTDSMFVAGSERALFERFDVCGSNHFSFENKAITPLPEHMARVLNIKKSAKIFNQEGVLLPFGNWLNEPFGLKGFVKSCGTEHLLVCANQELQAMELRLPRRMRRKAQVKIYSSEGWQELATPEQITLQAGQSIILTA
jgi:hypothetical protein